MKKFFFAIGIIVLIVVGICISDFVKLLNSSNNDCCSCKGNGEFTIDVCCTCTKTIILPNMPS